MDGSKQEVPKTQRAWRVIAQGHPSRALRLDSDIPVPSTLKPNDVLIKVHAAGLNPVDYKLMSLMPNFVAGRPFVAGYEYSGTVVDSNNTTWKAGDEVVVFLNPSNSSKTKQGALAEYVFAPSDCIARRPENTTPVEAAGILLTAVTAWQALFEAGKLEEGQSIFINGGSTAVGLFAIQIAKSRGCRVTVTASPRNEERVRSLGADEVIDYTKGDFVSHLISNPPSPKYHLILDIVGQLNKFYPRCESYLAPGGTFVTVGFVPPGIRDIPALFRLLFAVSLPGWLGGVRRKFKSVMCTPKHEDIVAVCELVAEGRMRPVVDSVYEFGDLKEAYDHLMSQRVTGKVIVKVEQNVE